MKTPNISDLKLEQLAQGVLGAEEEGALRKAVESDEGAARRIAEILESDAALRAEFPAEQVEVEVARRLRVVEAVEETGEAKTRIAFGLGFKLAASMAAAACVAVVLILFAPFGEEDPGYRLKGEPVLLVHRVVDAGTEQLEEGAVALEGDRIQLSIVPNGFDYGMVVSFDGNGEVTLHYPLSGTGRVEQAETVFSLPHSYQLDEAPDFERFILVMGRKELDAKAILERTKELAMNEADALDSPLKGLENGEVQTSFVLKKVSN